MQDQTFFTNFEDFANPLWIYQKANLQIGGYISDGFVYLLQIALTIIKIINSINDQDVCMDGFDMNRTSRVFDKT